MVKAFLEGVKAPGMPRLALGIMVPHAGYVYSGRVAGEVYRRLTPPETAVLIGPNHHGAGASAAIMVEGEWATPLGQVQVDTALAAALKAESPEIQVDDNAHRGEHSLEVQLPFLQTLNPEIRIVPLILSVSNLPTLVGIGRHLAAAIRKSGGHPLIVASSDMNHYESHEETLAKDTHALEAVLALDDKGLWEAVRKHGISMCGYMPTIVMISAAKELGASRAELVAHTTSAEVSGDRSHTVGYAGVIVE